MLQTLKPREPLRWPHEDFPSSRAKELTHLADIYADATTPDAKLAFHWADAANHHDNTATHIAISASPNLY